MTSEDPGIRKLMAAVLGSAVEDLVKNDPDSRNRKESTEYLNAYHWVFQEDNKEVYSFETVCESLDLNADELRTKIQQALDYLNPLKEAGLDCRSSRGLTAYQKLQELQVDDPLAVMQEMYQREPNKKITLDKLIKHCQGEK